MPRLPTITGVPSTRPTCPGCGKPAGVWTDNTRNAAQYVIARTFRRWDGYTPHHFCTLRCALRYAAYMFEKHGTRLQEKKP